MHRLARQKCRTSSGQKFHAGDHHYEFMGLLGNGAVGIVRKARNLSTGQIVAVKLLAPDPKYIDVAAFDDVEQRFRREGIRGAHLRHENLVEVIAFEDNIDGASFDRRSVTNPFIVMEYVGGHTLESLIKKMAVSNGTTSACVDKQTLFIANRVSAALCYLHQRKITHRDVKPANVFLSTSTPGSTPSVVKLGDFGVTKWGDFLATAASGTLTVTRQQGLGTLKYMSPEQAVRPKDVTVRSDMFSLGITLYELFTAQILPSPHHVFEIMSARLKRENIIAKLWSLGVKCPSEHAGLFELLLDLFLTAPNGRPAAPTIEGRTGYLMEELSERE
ncbi:MAG TPA: serine/threonine-protein kinase [Candidatus Acidoferrales bacterium]|nr:serine/threonine-protein kinase [Candidatus Acidoferrales bacterium]